MSINSLVVEQYFKQMLEVANTLGVQINNNELLQTIMRFPDTLKQPSEELDEAEWLQLKAGTEKALEMTDLFRKREGEVLIKDILHRIDLIKAYAAEVPQYEGKPVSYTHLDVYKRQVFYSTRPKGSKQNGSPS